VAAFDSDRESIRRLASAMPVGVNWDRLAAEMSANVRVGLEARGMRGLAESQADGVLGMAGGSRQRRSCDSAGERLVAEHAPRPIASLWVT